MKQFIILAQGERVSDSWYYRILEFSAGTDVGDVYYLFIVRLYATVIVIEKI